MELSNNINNNQTTSDLLDLLGGLDMMGPPPTTLLTNNNFASPMSILDDNENRKIPESNSFGLISGSFDILSGAAPLDDFSELTGSNVKVLTAFDKNDLLVQLSTQQSDDHMQILMTTTNNSTSTIEQYLFQVRSCLKLKNMDLH